MEIMQKAKILAESDHIRTYSQLNLLGTRLEMAKPFIEVEGRRQTMLGEFCA